MVFFNREQFDFVEVILRKEGVKLKTNVTFVSTLYYAI